MAGYSAAALPFRNVTSQRLAGALRSAEAKSEALNEEVANAQKTNEDHEATLEDFRNRWKERAKRVEALIARRERHRRTQHSSWVSEVEEEVTKRFVEAEKRLEAVDRANLSKQQERQKEFDRLMELFHTQLRLRAPVKLWEGRAEQHAKKAKVALFWFVGFTFLAILVGVFVPFCFGDYIAESFYREICDLAEPPNCAREFSVKGPLTLSGILVLVSLVLWGIRLQYRLYLSERHLALDASEKQAFAETYLAMKEGEDVGSGNEAIVLASLFRPTQDGIIKDDESGFDLSSAAILAKQLGR